MNLKQGKRRGKDKPMWYFLLFSLALHAVFLLCSGRLLPCRHFERRIEVDLREVDLRTLPAAQPQRSIPRPYTRFKAVPPHTQKLKTALRSLSSVIPRFSRPLARPQEGGSLQARSPQVVGKIYRPLPDEAVDKQKRSAGGEAIFGRVKAFSLPAVPMRARHVYANIDQSLAYQRMIRQRIEEHKRFPPLAIKRGWEGNVVVRFLVHRDGQAEQIKVTRSSKITLLDRAAIEAIKNGSPFPPFPQSIHDDSLLIEVSLNFELRQGG